MIERLWRLADEGDLAAERELGALLRRVGDLEGLAMLGDREAAEALAFGGNPIWGAMLSRCGRNYHFGPTGLRCWRVKANYPAWIRALKINPLHLPIIFDVAYRMPFSEDVTVRKQGKHGLRATCTTHQMCGAVAFRLPKRWRAEINFSRWDATGKGGPVDWSRENTAATSARVARLEAAQWLGKRLERSEVALLTYNGG